MALRSLMLRVVVWCWMRLNDQGFRTSLSQKWLESSIETGPTPNKRRTRLIRHIMTSERVQRRIDGLLDQAEEAVYARDWSAVDEIARSVLAVEPKTMDISLAGIDEKYGSSTE